MTCPVCKPHANRRRATHCPIGWKLFRAYEAAAQEYATKAAANDGTVFSAGHLKEAKDEAGRRYRAHVDENWNPNTPEAA